MKPKPVVAREDQPAAPLWRNVSFLLMWSSVAASGFGDRLIQLAAWSMLGVQLAGTDAASIQAGVSFFFFLPYALAGPVAGWLADTLPRKWIMLFCDETRAVLLLVTLLLIPAGAVTAIAPTAHWKVYALITAIGLLAAIFSPAKAATIPQIVTVRQLQPANAIVLGIAVIASLIGFAAGGPLIEHASLAAGLIVAVLSYAISGTFFAFLRLRPRTSVRTGPRPNQLQRMLDAARYVWHHRPVFQLIGLSVMFWAAATALMAAIAALCKTRYSIPDDQVISHTAIMMATMGAGMLASSLWVAWVNTRRESMWFAMIGLWLAGLFMVAMGLNRSYNVGLVLSLGTGFFGNTAMICVATTTQLIAPDYVRGRVFGVRDLFNTSSAVLVNLWIWRLPEADRAMIAVLYAVAGLLVLVAAWGFWHQITPGPFPDRASNVVWRLCRAYTLVWHRLRWVGRHNVPATGAVILAPNHTTGLDPFLIQAIVPRRIRWVMLRGYQYPVLQPLWRLLRPIAIDQNGRHLSQMKEMVRQLNDNRVIGIFPEGGAQRRDRDLKPFQQGIGLLARRSAAAIVPVWIDGTPRTRHMLWHFLKPSRSTVTFGDPFRPDKSMTHHEITQELRRRMLTIAREHKAAQDPTRPGAAMHGLTPDH